MDLTETNAGVLQLLLLIIFIVPAIFFLIAQQNTLKVIQPKNRRMNPGEVWLQLIPIFGLVWQFIVVARIADSLRSEFASWTNEDSFLELPDSEAVDLIHVRPTHDIGISYCALFCCSFIPFIGGLASIAGLVCWIVYWGKLSGYKAKIEQRIP